MVYRVFVQSYSTQLQPIQNEAGNFMMGVQMNSNGDPALFETTAPVDAIANLHGFNVGCWWDIGTGVGRQFTVMHGRIDLHGDIAMGRAEFDDGQGTG